MAMAMAMAFSLSKSLSSLFLPSRSQPSLVSPPSLQLPVKKASTRVSSSLTTADEITAVTCPSLAYANTLFFKSGVYNAQVVVAEDEPEEKLLSRFRRAVFLAGVIQECRRRMFFESSQDKKKRKAREASQRNRKSCRGCDSSVKSTHLEAIKRFWKPYVVRRRPQPKVSAQEETPKKKDDEEDDNWELPEGDLS
ncbi:Ribosomal protein S21 [Corchorus capsularis]|uniref:Ribosomal protein S21 n=1 Tax=Corchorus capsularis TaxID=210143 RepID=A0A1R3JIN0_COCAP|nr:Ribosomal protein S21 [Corchorus capsularis]